MTYVPVRHRLAASGVGLACVPLRIRVAYAVMAAVPPTCDTSDAGGGLFSYSPRPPWAELVAGGLVGKPVVRRSLSVSFDIVAR